MQMLKVTETKFFDINFNFLSSKNTLKQNDQKTTIK